MLPPNVLAQLRAESLAAHTQHMTEAKTSASNVADLARLVSVRHIDEPTAQQAMAVSKILALP